MGLVGGEWNQTTISRAVLYWRSLQPDGIARTVSLFRSRLSGSLAPAAAPVVVLDASRGGTVQ